MTHIFDEKKSAQIRLKIAPIARTTSRVGQIWSQIVFLIFWKIQYPDSGYFQLRFSSQNLDVRKSQDTKIKPQHAQPSAPGTEFFKKSKKWSETRFGPLLMSSGRLVLFLGDFEHFFFRQKCESKNKKKILKNSNGLNI